MMSYFSFFLGQQPVVVLSDPHLLREVFVEQGSVLLCLCTDNRGFVMLSNRRQRAGPAFAAGRRRRRG